MRNSLAAIALSKDKLHMKQAFEQAQGINHARLFPMDNLDSIQGKIVCKKRRGCKARDQFIIDVGENPTVCHWDKNPHFEWISQLDPERYIIEQFLPCVKEYRVYVGRKRGEKYKCFHVDIKAPREGCEESDTSNHATCRFVSTRDGKVANYEVKRQALRATKALGLNLAAVDIGLDDDGHAWVFETNTKPGIDREDVLAKWQQFRSN